MTFQIDTYKDFSSGLILVGVLSVGEKYEAFLEVV